MTPVSWTDALFTWSTAHPVSLVIPGTGDPDRKQRSPSRASETESKNTGSHLAPGVSNRGARIRTGDLTDPNGARYQAALRPETGDYPRRAATRARQDATAL